MFLPHDAVHKRGLGRHAVSVRLSVTFVHSVETNKHVFKTLFTIWQPYHSSFSISDVTAIFQRGLPSPLTSGTLEALDPTQRPPPLRDVDDDQRSSYDH